MTRVSSRFIPTHVGNTRQRQEERHVLPVHPHACGEHFIIWDKDNSGNGSSPRMWGTQYARGAGKKSCRFIPTHVGNTGFSRNLRENVSVHPHACGEHWRPASSTTRSAGSSPRMWGTPPATNDSAGCLRFIPTHVGNTYRARLCLRKSPVHPHACGEHPICEQCQRPGIGSSPRMWGTLRASICRAPGSRFIPTHVGNTLTGRVPSNACAVHPHACGEHLYAARRNSGGGGSSPRMWGTPRRQTKMTIMRRFIPTHVGNTHGKP